MADKTQELGTKFTGDITDISAKVRALMNLLLQLDTFSRTSANIMGQPWKNMATAATDSVSKIKTASSQIVAEAQKAQTAMAKIGGEKESKSPAPRSLSDQIKNALRVSAAYGLAGVAIGTVVGALKGGISEIVEFDQALKNLQAITGATNDQVGVMGKEIKRVAQETKYSTKEVADGVTILGQAGLSAEEATSVIGPAAMLATGTLSKMDETVDLLSTTLRAFNMDAVEAGRVTDVMAAAVNKSKLDVDKLRTVFNYVGSSAAQMGLSIEELAASTMVLANNGMRASTIGTGLRQVLARLVSPGKKLREAFEEHGIALDKVNPSVVGYQKAMENMIPILWDAEKKTIDMSKAYELFELRGAQAAAVLVEGFSSGKFQKALDNVYDVGSAEQMAAKQAEGLGIMAKNLMDRLGLLAVAIGDLGVTGALRGFIDILRSATTATTAFIEATGQGFEQWSLSTEYMKRDAGELVVESNRVVGSLGVYKGALEAVSKELASGSDVSKEHLSILKRLIKDHPELAGDVDLTKLSFESLSGVISSVNKLMDTYSKTSSAGRAKKASILEDDLARLEEESARYEKASIGTGFLSKIFGGDAKNMYANYSTEAKKTKTELSELYAGWAEDIANASGKNAVEAEKMVRNLFEIGTVSSETANKIRDQLVVALKSVKLDFDPETYAKKLKGFPEIVQKVYDSLDPARKFDFREKFANFENEIARVRKSYETKGGSPAEEDAVIAAKQDEFLKEFQEKIKKSGNQIIDKESQAAQKRIQIQESYYATVAKLTSDAREKIEQVRLKESAAIRKQYEEALLFARKSGEDTAAIKEKYDNLQKQNDRFYSQQTFDYERKKSRELLDIEIIGMKQANEEKKRATIDSSGGLSSIKENEAQITIKSLEKIVDIERKYRDETVANYKEGSEQALAAEKDYQEAALALKRAETEEATRQAELRVQQTIKELKLKLKFATQYSAEYYKIMQKLRDLGEIEPVSLEDALAGTDDLANGIRLGVMRVAKENKTVSERVAEVWQTATGNIANAFSTLFDDVLVGKVKSAGEYIVSFLSSVAKAVNNVLANVIAQGITTGIGGLFNTGGSNTTSSAYNNIQWDTGKAFAAGGWITEPIVGRGINTGRGYTLGERGPELVTPANQVNSGPSAPSVSVIVNNNTGAEMKQQQSSARFDGQGWVVSVVLDAVKRNVGGLRTILGG